jgi:hypothetical protein
MYPFIHFKLKIWLKCELELRKIENCLKNAMIYGF